MTRWLNKPRRSSASSAECGPGAGEDRQPPALEQAPGVPRSRGKPWSRCSPRPPSQPVTHSPPHAREGRGQLPLLCLRLRLQETALCLSLSKHRPDRGCGRLYTAPRADPAAKDTLRVCLGQPSPQTWHVTVTGHRAGPHKLSSVPPTRWGHHLPPTYRRELRLGASGCAQSVPPGAQ